MGSNEQRSIVVTGATGRQGSAVVRHLLNNGWQVRALTRHPQSTKARTLAALGATVVRGNMEDPASLEPLFAGAYGVYSVQTPYPHGTDGEIRQGKNVADAARTAGVRHLVYGSAGTGQKGTGIPSWESKLQIEEYMQELGLPLTILRPMAFMELMTDKGFFPALTTWHVMPLLLGASYQIGCLCTDDLGAIAAKMFAHPEQFIGQDLKLISDKKSIDECRNLYRTVRGKNPPRLPLPVPLFKRFGFIGRDLSTMWSWLRTAELGLDPETTRSIYPEALTVEAWVRRQGVTASAA